MVKKLAVGIILLAFLIGLSSCSKKVNNGSTIGKEASTSYSLKYEAAEPFSCFTVLDGSV